jgi:hypothetical protein
MFKTLLENLQKNHADRFRKMYHHIPMFIFSLLRDKMLSKNISFERPT